MEPRRLSRIVIAAQRGGAGKTLFTLGLIRRLLREGLRVAPFKKGPDYIDAGWLSRAAERPCRNLDPFLMEEKALLKVFREGASGADIAVVEGNRGLFDGVDLEGTCSTARLARLLQAPVILVLDCTKVTRTLAAVVKGFQAFDPGVHLAGVVLNRVARARHENIVTRAIEHYTGVPVLGAVPRLRIPFPERHLGLIPWQEYGGKERLFEALEEALAGVEVHRLLEVAAQAPPLLLPEEPLWSSSGSLSGVRIGVFRDQAFQFYYPENLEILALAGAELVFIDALREKRLPSVSALYLGGGFPETQAEALAENSSLMKDLKEAAEDGLPVYAECGGILYLGRELSWKGRTYPMCGVLPVDFEVRERPAGHGYSLVGVVAPNPYYPEGLLLQGHEFHYSVPTRVGEGPSFVLKVERGFGFDGLRDGILYKRVFGTYTHVHAVSTPAWLEGWLRALEGAEKGPRWGESLSEERGLTKDHLKI
ncbi:cobyrinate a,c-diamide synthase [Thermosulfurimonas marina]|uniref:Cobyrinate a,c-diamide synthase n=1 Tax=Thermosulfurimonas marina TaxID=2047767 RepID=A0A6H1WQW9_9BACT|nr:cobyrinate a,c-diamide synthase [Thermosulfurimonas marina]QJA05536.1 cobyrinate a,c-diamide synthase [Thermosulfurimonas marina]